MGKIRLLFGVLIPQTAARFPSLEAGLLFGLGLGFKEGAYAGAVEKPPTSDCPWLANADRTDFPFLGKTIKE